ncbi:hypothetical protein BDW75DRAFT_229656 [Aspergillus navahoensis]
MAPVLTITGDILPAETSSTTTPSTEGGNASNYHAIQAKNVIQLELGNSRSGLSQERQSIMKSALQLVTKIASSERHQADAITEGESFDDELAAPEAPPRDMLFMLLRGPTESVGDEWPDHISDKAYERMVTALLQEDLDPDGRLFHQYSICVYAIYRVFQISRVTDNLCIRRQLSQSWRIYTRAAIRSIRQFNLLQWPDLISIQSLIASALLMQHLGRFNHALLGRPVSLPDLEVSPVDLITLDPSSSYGSLLRAVLELAEVQGDLHRISCSSDSSANSAIVETCQALETKIQNILPTLQMQNCDSLPKIVQYDCVALDFCYYAILVEVQRTRLKSFFTPLIHRQCLLNARKCLRAFQFLQEHQHPAEPSGFGGAYPSFLTCAFFVIFCNIIGTLDHGDYRLMRSIIKNLSRFKQDSHLEKLLSLLRSLERLCEPLFLESHGANPERQGLPVQQEEAATFVANGHTISQNTMDFVPQTYYLGSTDRESLDNESMPLQISGVDFSADELMWQLFSSEIPAGWLTADMHPFNI